jgi:hypothetical protein
MTIGNWIDSEGRTFHDLPKSAQQVTLDWIEDQLWPRETPLHGRSSYGLKHVMHNATRLYVTNAQFKDAMILAGYAPVRKNELNHRYRLSKKSPAFDWREPRFKPKGWWLKEHYPEVFANYEREWY